MMNWLLEKNIFEESFINNLKQSILNNNMKFVECSYIPFAGGKYNDLFDENDCVLFYGSLNLAKQIQRETSWQPGTFCNLKNFKCQTYYCHLGEYLLNQDYIMLPLKELIRRKDYICDLFGANIFVRPDCGDKAFTGKVVNYHDISLDAFDYGFYYEDDSILTIVSSAKKIDKEWRFVVCDHKVITGSQYKINCELEVEKGYPQDAFDFAQKIADIKWQPDSCYTIDVSLSEGKYSILEINSFSCSGMYDCDANIIVKEVSKVAENIWKENINE